MIKPALVLSVLLVSALIAPIQSQSNSKPLSSSSLKSYSVNGFTSEANYINVNAKKGHHLWYFVAPSQNKPQTDPIILWMQGGPGAASNIGLFYEIGPFYINQSSLELEPNLNSWNLNATLLFIDQPIGTGWSYSDDPFDTLNIHQDQMMDEMVTFLEMFFGQHTQYQSQDFYIFGESYGGHYVPVLGSKLLASSSSSSATRILKSVADRFQGIGIGDGWVDPRIQYQAYIDYAYNNNLIDSQVRTDLNFLSGLCNKSIDSADWVAAAATCNLIVEGVFLVNPHMSFYDIRLKCPGNTSSHDCYDFSSSVKYMERPSIRQELHTVNKTWHDPEVPFAIIAAVDGDEEQSYRQCIPKLLNAHKKVLIYNGRYDFAANYLGAERWLHSLPWSSQDQFNAQPLNPWGSSPTNSSQPAGYKRSYKNLSYIRIADAGHMVPMNVPTVALDMVREFLVQ